MKNKAVLAYIEKRKADKTPKSAPKPKRLELTPKPKRLELTPKDRARYAVEHNGGDLWMQKWIDWDDKSIPVGKRRVAFVRYLTMTKGLSLAAAKYHSKIYIR